MKFIDVNCMIGEWIYKDLRFKDVQCLRAEMQRLRIEKSMVFDSRAWLYDPKVGNSMLLQTTSMYKELIPVIVLTPLIDQEFGSKESIYEYLKENKIGAIRIFPTDHNFTLNLWNIEKMFTITNEICMPVLLEGREREGTIDKYFTQIYEIAKTFKNTPLILLSVGFRNLRTLYNLFDSCPNIFIDTSTFLTYRGIEDVIKYFGSERIVFGTRMPFLEAGVSVGRIIYADISNKVKENIAYNNIYRMLHSNKLINDMKAVTVP